MFLQEDLVSLGKIVLALSCNSFIAIQRENLQQSMELVTTNYRSVLEEFGYDSISIKYLKMSPKDFFISAMIYGT